MRINVNTRYEQMTLAVSVMVKHPTRVRIKVYDAQKPRTIFTNRYKTIDKFFKFYVRLPMSPQKITIELSDDQNGGDITNRVKVTNIEKLGLQKRMDEVDIIDYSVMCFVDFAQRFSFNSSYLEPNTYVSDNGGYKIQLLDTIRNRNGKELRTPARISKHNGRIQVSKKLFDKYTVAMRMAILLHEFSHYYLNEDIDDEIEADLNGLLIYLGLGYPRIDGYEAFLTVFEETPTQQNKERFDTINRFIQEFENKNFIIY